MKRKIFFVFLMIFSFMNISLAKSMDIKNKVYSYPVPSEYGFQGFTTVDDYIVGFLITKDESKSIMLIVDINKETSKTKHFNNIGHANDVSYNSKTGLIYVVHGGGTSIVHVFDKDFKKINDIDVGLPIRSLTYVENDDVYLVRTVAYGYVLDNNLKPKRNTPFIAGLSFSPTLAHQGWSYYDKKLFYANWSWIRKGGDGTSSIFIYGTNGDKYEKIELDNNLGELEDISFYNNKMILGFESKEDTIDFYIEDIPEIVKIHEEVNKEEKKNNNIFYFFLGFLIFFILAFELKKRF